MKPQLLAHLTPDEQQLFAHLVAHHLRLKQEHLPQRELLAALAGHYATP